MHNIRTFLHQCHNPHVLGSHPQDAVCYLLVGRGQTTNMEPAEIVVIFVTIMIQIKACNRKKGIKVSPYIFRKFVVIYKRSLLVSSVSSQFYD